MRLDAIACGAGMALFATSKYFNRVSYLLLGSAVTLIIFIVYRVHFSGRSYISIKSDELILFLTPLAFALLVGYLSTILSVGSKGWTN